MYKIIKKIVEGPVKYIFRIFGLEVTAFNGAMSDYSILYRIIRNNDIDLIVDVGANVGQYASLVGSIGYKNQIFSIEPLNDAHEILCKKSERDFKWKVLPRTAIGDSKGSVTINKSNNSVSSSILNILPIHINSEESSSYVSSEVVSLERLDSFLAEFIDESHKNIFLKIDTQGFEDEVLNGASNILSRINFIQCELSLRPLYENQKLIEDIILKLRSYGFTLVAIAPGFKDPHSKELLQCDGFFARLS